MKLSLLCAAFFALIAVHVQAAPPPLHVAGTKLQDDAGRVVRLRGVNIAGLEWNSRGDHTLASVETALGNWHAGLIRLPLSQDRWFGKAVDTDFGKMNRPQTDGGVSYRRLVDRVVQRVSGHNAYVLLDLHWNDANQWGRYIGQHDLPDDNSVVFWKSLAARYADNPAVLFDLYNEPHDVSWDVWQHGGDVTERFDDGGTPTPLQYHSPGMQALLDTVRGTGAKNVVVAGGLDWAYDLNGLLDGHALSDPRGHGVMYATHIYPWKRDWDAHVTPAAAKYAVFAGEIGCEPYRQGQPAYQNQEPPAVWAPLVLDYLDKHGLSWTAWDLHPGAAPCLIQSWDYTPTSYWGVPVRRALASGPNK